MLLAGIWIKVYYGLLMSSLSFHKVLICHYSTSHQSPCLSLQFMLQMTNYVLFMSLNGFLIIVR